MNALASIDRIQRREHESDRVVIRALLSDPDLAELDRGIRPFAGLVMSEIASVNASPIARYATGAVTEIDFEILGTLRPDAIGHIAEMRRL